MPFQVALQEDDCHPSILGWSKMAVETIDDHTTESILADIIMLLAKSVPRRVVHADS